MTSRLASCCVERLVKPSGLRRAEVMKVRLVSVGNDVKATEIALDLPVLVGRGRDTTLTLPHPLISRRHCELYQSDGKLMVRDLGSLNGTYVGSRRITEAEVPPGELLTVGTLNFRVVYGEGPQDDETESPFLVGNDDSTQGTNKSQAVASDGDLSDDGTEPPDRPAGPVRPRGVPIERDTEWQIGSGLPRPAASEEEDMSSWF
jgi:hypothetical protein